MMKYMKPLIWGVAPTVLGGIMYGVLIFVPSVPALLTILAMAGSLVLWGYLAYRIMEPEMNPAFQALRMCAFGAVMLALVLLQELVLKAYWTGFGDALQMYFLPGLTVVAAVVSIAAQGDVLLWPFYIVTWLCMFLIAWLGCARRKKKG